MFKLRGTLSRSQTIILGLVGLLIFIAAWWGIAEILSVKRPVVDGYTTRIPSEAEAAEQGINLDSLLTADSLRFENATEFKKVYPILPTPVQVVGAFPALFKEKGLIANTLTSIWRNLQGYFWAVFICIPIGFVVGLIPLFRGLFSKPIEAMRFLPITALIGVFIIWFGIYDEMKVAFLAFGIIVFLLPAVIQRIDEVEKVYLQTTFTLGATNWQTVKSVYIPAVMSKLIDDIRVLTAVSWTYIIITEYINKDGGLGALIHIKRRLLQMPDMFAIILLIILIGFLQDRIFVYLGKRLFPFRHYKTLLPGNLEVRYGIWMLLGIFAIAALSQMIMPGLEIGTIALIVALAAVVFIFYGEYKVQRALWQQS